MKTDHFSILQFNLTSQFDGRYIYTVNNDPGQPNYYLGTRSPQPTDGEELVLGIPQLLGVRIRDNHLVERDVNFYPTNLDLYPVDGGTGSDGAQAVT